MLNARELKVFYGVIQGLKGVDIDVYDREIVTLIGSNGAGKTSTLNGIVNLVRSSGRVSFLNDDISRSQTHQIVRRGLALLRQVGLEEKAQQMPAQLSGGQQQRVAIARALASSPQIILFDEPTSALDPEMIGEVLQVMKTLAHSGITMLVVTHEMQFAREIADRVVFIDGGDILEVAPPAEFFAHPQHARARRFLQKVLDPLHQESLE
ncbi:amino acid ABC transporter ATP-binding protein [Klebsiella pneumoniae]|uniref:amino acid ABC transporter ATP-binding protein n=1 Tax=Klebsiella pneumoniae TaxID=573 RepID=UPI002242DF38|nr:ATP-binding cassette domain-containing protein [Klebsiella pneumoniae]